MELPWTPPGVPWLMRQASSMISRSRRGLIGRTAFELRTGKPYRKRLPPFAEKVMYWRAGKPRSRLQDRWTRGLFCGVQDRSDEVAAGTRDRVINARTLKRLDGVQRIGDGLVNEVRGTPLDPAPGNPEAAWTTGASTGLASHERTRTGSQEPVRETWRHWQVRCDGGLRWLHIHPGRASSGSLDMMSGSHRW